MKKLFTIFAGLSIALGVMAETEFTFSSAADMNQTKDGITLSIAIGSGETAPTVTKDFETQKPEMRVYAGNTITLSSNTNLTNIQLVCAKSSASNKNYADMSVSNGTLTPGGVAEDKNDWKVDSWTGSATEVVFTFSGSKGQRRIQRIVIDGEPIVINPDEDPLPTAEDLDPNYTYAEPTIVNVPDTQIFKKEYAFIDNNILVHCSLGSIVFANVDTTEGDTIEAAYFGCQADQKLTITATQPIQGIAINGNVRKAFTATCSAGDIFYCNDPDVEIAADPVLVVRNINSKTVTVNCIKNLSCYGLRVYFAGNPDPVCVEEGMESVPQTTKAKKVIRDGQLYILRGNQLYNALGTKL